ncbi:MAG TPA: transaldolase [Acidimicrobiia bacterium]|nr:transaldolase [Acidimicrobiia bacterium]
MTKLQSLFAEFGQSPWLDNLSRPYLQDGTLRRLVGDGIRGVTANPTILARAIEGTAAYDEQFAALVRSGLAVPDAYWELVVDDIAGALAVLRPVFDDSEGTDGFVSVEVAPELAHDTVGTVAAARGLHQRIAAPNLFVKIPATAAGIPAIRAMVAEGRSINITLIFSLARYAEVIEAYLSGLEAYVAGGGDPSRVHSVASFFVSRVDTEIDARLEKLGISEGSALRGRAAVAQAKLAYRLFQQHFSGERWSRLSSLGAHVQRPLWASTSTKNPAYSDTVYVESLIGPDTVNTLTEATVAAFEDHGVLVRTVDTGVEEAAEVMRRLAATGVDMDDVGLTLEEQGVASFHASFQEVLAALDTKAAQLAR